MSAHLMQVIAAPHVSEKSSMLGEAHNQYVFKVARHATKHDIKRAVEGIFKVTVSAVRTINFEGKRKRFGQRPGQRNAWKKAYVSLPAGQEIDFAVEG